MTERELAEVLRNNPELVVEDGLINYSRDSTSCPTPLKPPRVKLSEHDLQAAVFAECDQRSVLRVEYGLIFAIPNGQYRQGQRMEPGLRAGVPDLFLPVARHGYHGLFIELKCGSNKPSQVQRDWVRNLTAEGYLCKVLWDDVDNVMWLIEWYLEGTSA